MATDSNTARAQALSRQLARAHNTLRDQLRTLTAKLGSPTADERALPAYCLAFCSALTTHHEGEDAGLFAELLRARPDLEPVVRNLVQDHGMIAGILTSVRDLAEEATSATPERRERIRRELEGLAAIMESHFRYEERALGAVLDQGEVQDTGWSGPVFQFEA